METSIDGYAYQLSGRTISAILSHSLHALFEFGHIYWMFWARRTSATWDRIPVVLAHNSRPAGDRLRTNTSADIMKKKTFEITAKIEVTNGDSVQISVDAGF